MGNDEWARVPMQTSAWLSSCLEVWPGDVERVEVEGAVAPLVRRRGALELIGRELSEPSDVLWRDPEAAARVAARLRRKPLVLRRLLADSPLVSGLRLAVVRRSVGAPVVALGDAWRGADGALSRRRAADMRRARRRAESLGDVVLEVTTPAPAEVEAALARVAAVEDSGWKRNAGTSLARDDRRRAFFAAYGRRAAEEGILRCAFLTIGGRDAAAHLAVEWKRAYWLLKIGYDTEFARASPGQLLMFDTVRAAAERGLERYELLGAAAPWTEMWTHEHRETVSLVALAPSLRAAAAVAGEAVRTLRRRGS